MTRYNVEWRDGDDTVCQGFAHQDKAVEFWRGLVVAEGLGQGPWGAVLVFLGPDGERAADFPPETDSP